MVPLRDGRSGKTRLASVLGPEERTRLVTLLARHVVTTLLAAPVTRVLVVTGDPRFAAGALPPDPRVEVVRQPEERQGLNAAVALGRELALERAPGRVLVMHADLPLLAADDVLALLAPAAPLVLAPDRAGTGTNALVLDPAVRGFRFRFGPGSRVAHTREAAALGLRVAVVERPGTTTDLDTPGDWAALPPGLRARLGGPTAQPDQ